MKNFATLSNEERQTVFNDLADVMYALERQIEWTLSDYIDHREVNLLLQPVRQVVNEKLKELNYDEGR